MAHESEEVLHGKSKNSTFSIQVDESTDLTNKCHGVAFVRFVNEGEIQENFLYCKELHEMSKGKTYSIFNPHIWKQEVSPGRIVLASVLMVLHQWLAP